MFTTKVTIQPSEYKIEYSSKILSLGSCFAENIGSKLQQACFDIDINPFGVLFNPASIADSLRLLVENKVFTSESLFQSNSLWASYAHSTLFSAENADSCLQKINARFHPAVKQLFNADYLILTFGTAWIYKLIESQQVVANCHKQPASNFVRERLNVELIVDMFSTLIDNLHKVNPDLKLIFTVSPVRHWKDGHTENSISKGILLQAIQELVRLHKNALYFPAYEIVMDELRDYRFYAADMLHPSEVAVDYIYKLFSEAFFDSETTACMQLVNQYKNALSHRPFNTNYTEFEKLTNYIATKRTEILHKYPILSDRI